MLLSFKRCAGDMGATAVQIDEHEPEGPTVVSRRSLPTRVAAQVARSRGKRKTVELMFTFS